MSDGPGQPTPAIAPASEPWPAVKVVARWSGLEQPVGIASARDESGRLFVVERAGRVRVIEDGDLRERPFLDITDRVSVGHLEQGLLSIAFPPGSGGERRVYACYAAPGNDVVVSRFHVARGVALPDSEDVVLRLWHPYRNHNGGQLQFGPDGYLYVGIGDGGSEYDPNGYGQDPRVALGKILRVDTESPRGARGEGTERNRAYGVPEDNPFVGVEGFVPETWHWGLRNPWRFSFDRETGDMYIGDVGQDSREEIDFAPAGAGGLNFGWSLWEGTRFHPADGPRSRHRISSLGEQDLVFPIAEYGHLEDGGTAVIGGYVYRGTRFAAMRGVYLYADYGSRTLYGLRRGADGAWESATLTRLDQAVTTFGEGDDGELYLAGFEGDVCSIEA